MLFSQCRSNADEHTSAQLSFSTKFQRWNNIGSSTLNRRNSINVVSTLFCQRWNNVDKCTSAQLSFSTKYQRWNNVDNQRWCVCWEPCLFQNFAIVRISVYLGQKAYSESCFCRYTQAYYSIMIVIITFTFFFFHINLTYLSVKFEKTYVFWPQRH